MDDEDDDEEFPHQLVIFAVGGLASGSFSAGWMPFTFSAAQATTNHARSVYQQHYESLGWLSYWYAATLEEFGCSADDHCAMPSEVSSHRSLLDVLQYDYGYAVHVFSENAQHMDESLRHHYNVQGFSPTTLQMMQQGLNEHELPQTPRRVLVFHFDGADQVGHSMGYERENYHAELLCIDWQIQRLSQALLLFHPEQTTFALISDHGGRNYDHAHFDLDVLQVPMAWWGYGICPNRHIDHLPVDSTQWAPTLLDAIGLDLPSEWIHPSLDENVVCDEDEDDAPPQGMVAYWNETFDGVCPVHIGFRYRSAHYADEARIITTVVLFGAAFAMSVWLFQHPGLRQ